MFGRELTDVTDLIRTEVRGKKEPNHRRIIDLLDQLLDAWDYVYDPISICISRSLHTIYGLYVQAKKSNEPIKAEGYLRLYKAILYDRQTGKKYEEEKEQ